MQDSPITAVPTEPGTPFAGGFYAGRLRVGDALFALIVAPKALGETTGKWLDTYAEVPGAASCFDGLANTNAMAEAGSVIANWARGLAIDGHTDWYVPARDELELIYRALKPTTDSNSCSFRDGDNASSVPAGYPYTAAVPAQTEVAAFRSGGPEAFDKHWYWSSTQYSQHDAFIQDFSFGYQDDSGKKYEARVRAVRLIQLTT